MRKRLGSLNDVNDRPASTKCREPRQPDSALLLPAGFGSARRSFFRSLTSICTSTRSASVGARRGTGASADLVSDRDLGGVDGCPQRLPAPNDTLQASLSDHKRALSAGTFQAPPAGFEPATYGLEVRRSIQTELRGPVRDGVIVADARQPDARRARRLVASDVAGALAPVVVAQAYDVVEVGRGCLEDV